MSRIDADENALLMPRPCASWHQSAPSRPHSSLRLLQSGGDRVRQMPSVKVSFEGGLQHDFKSPGGLTLDVAAGTTLRQFPKILAEARQLEDPSRFCAADGRLAPGILFMVNDVDCEVCGLDVALNDGDGVTFISTLHGG